MTREELLKQLLVEGTMPGPLPGIPYDSPAEQKARRDALHAEMREADNYNPHRGPRPPRRTEPIVITHLTPGARCANCGSHKIEMPRPVVAA
jgi:hypothetical protein